MFTLNREAQRSIDARAASELGLVPSLLMEQAGLRIVEVIQEHMTATNIRAVLCFAGSGNNGGDAWVAARLLQALGISTAVVSTSGSLQLTDMTEPPEQAARLAQFAAEQLGIQVLTLSDIDTWLQQVGFTSSLDDLLVVDAVLGSGFDNSRVMSEEIEGFIASINDLGKRQATILSVDIPSGVDANSGLASESAVQADLTVTFLAPKQGCISWPGRGLCGVMKVRGLGLPKTWWEGVAREHALAENLPEVHWNTLASLATKVPSRDDDSHKGTNGRVLILAGCPDTPGAAVLATEAALRSGVGLTYVMVDPEIAQALLVRAPEAVISAIAPFIESDQEALQLDLEKVREAIKKVDAVVLGPGSGQTDRTMKLLELALQDAKFLLLDADALNVAAENPDILRRGVAERKKKGMAPPLMTPHPGEFKRLFPNLDFEDRLASTQEAARLSGCHVILKGAGTVIASPRERAAIRVNSSGNSALARGGSGDLLAGLCGSFLAQIGGDRNPTEQLETSLDLAVLIHGLAADLAVADRESETETGFSFQDWFASLPKAFARMGFT